MENTYPQLADLGIRRVQKGGGSFILNIPVVAVRTLGLRAGSPLRVFLSYDGGLHFICDDENDAMPIRGSEMNVKRKR